MNRARRESTNIVVLIALPEEHDTFLEQFPSTCSVPGQTLVRLEHEFNVPGHTLTSVLAENMGSDSASSAAYSAIEDLSPDLVVCLGIAGALSSDLAIGDVCLSSEIIDILHNTKFTTNRTGARSTRIEYTPRIYPVDTALQASARFLRSHPQLRGLLDEWTDACNRRKADFLKLPGFQEASGLSELLPTSFLVGPILCGPVSADKALNASLKSLNRKVLAIETESGGVARVCGERGVPLVTIRGISDKADSNKRALEKVPGAPARKLAMQNATAFFGIQCRNIPFVNRALLHANERRHGPKAAVSALDSERILKRTEEALTRHLEIHSAEFKNRPNNAALPMPRLRRLVLSEDAADAARDDSPISIMQALSEDKKVFIRLPRSYPDQTLAWSVGLSLLKGEIDGKQILPLVLSGDQVAPPSRTLAKAVDQTIPNSALLTNFAPVIVVDEPPFASNTKMMFLVEQIRSAGDFPVLIVSKDEGPVDALDRLRTDLGLRDYLTAPVPFTEIAGYLERAFEMGADEAEAIAIRLDDTFSRFRLHTHPAYFIGLQEQTLSALVDANQRAELIQLAVSGLLSFVVAGDKSEVKLSRTTREEFLSELAFEIRVKKATIKKSDLIQMIDSFAARKALEVEALEFARGFFAVGLLNDAGGFVSFSLPYLEAYLISDKLNSDPETARCYFDPALETFDYYTYDLYCEIGAHSSVVGAVTKFAEEIVAEVGTEKSVFEEGRVRPRALSTPGTLVELARQMGAAAEKMGSEPRNSDVRSEKQRLVDARETVRSKVGRKKEAIEQELTEDARVEIKRLNQLSRATALLATMVGSGAERLDGSEKVRIGQLLLTSAERFVDLWTRNRLKIDFEKLRGELQTDETIDSIIEQFELFEEERDRVRESLALFVDDQEMMALSSPLATVLHRLASSAGVRSLKPTVSKLQPGNSSEAILKAAWFMDVEAGSGRKALKSALREYRGSDLLRFVVANHLMWRVFWHHWQLTSRSVFVEAARSTLKPLGLLPTKDRERRVLSGHRAEEK